PFRDVRTHSIASHEDLRPQGPRRSVLIDRHVDPAVLASGRLGLGPEERVRALPDRVGRDRPVEHRTLDDDCLRSVAVDDELTAGWRELHDPMACAAINAANPSTITSVAISPRRFTTPAPSGIFCPGSVMIVIRIPRAIACSNFFPMFSRISENVGVDTMHVSVA